GDIRIQCELGDKDVGVSGRRQFVHGRARVKVGCTEEITCRVYVATWYNSNASTLRSAAEGSSRTKITRLVESPYKRSGLACARQIRRSLAGIKIGRANKPTGSIDIATGLDG